MPGDAPVASTLYRRAKRATARARVDGWIERLPADVRAKLDLDAPSPTRATSWREWPAYAAATRYDPMPLDFPEACLQAKAEWVLRADGWIAYHAHVPLLDEAGFPDLMAAHLERERGGLFVAELKTEKGALSAKQRVWLDTLSARGIACYVIRPRHWSILLAISAGTATAAQREEVRYVARSSASAQHAKRPSRTSKPAARATQRVT